jgi:hypothetical protein
VNSDGTAIPAKIVELKRRENTKDGNPRFHVITEGGGSFPTMPDGQVGYTIQNYVGQDVILTVDPWNRVIDVKGAED